MPVGQRSSGARRLGCRSGSPPRCGPAAGRARRSARTSSAVETRPCPFGPASSMPSAFATATSSRSARGPRRPPRRSRRSRRTPRARPAPRRRAAAPRSPGSACRRTPGRRRRAGSRRRAEARLPEHLGAVAVHRERLRRVAEAEQVVEGDEAELSGMRRRAGDDDPARMEERPEALEHLGVETARAAAAARDGFGVELDQRVDRHRHAAAHDQRVQIDRRDVGSLGASRAETEQHARERLAVDRGLAAERTEQRARGEPIGQRARRGLVERRRREHDVARAPRRARRRRRASRTARTADRARGRRSARGAAHLLGDQQTDARRPPAAPARAAPRPRAATASPSRSPSRTRSRSVLCAIASPHSFTTTGKPSSRRGGARLGSASHQLLGRDRHAELGEQRLRVVLGEGGRCAGGRIAAQGTRPGCTLPGAPPARRPHGDRKARQARRLGVARPSLGAARRPSSRDSSRTWGYGALWIPEAVGRDPFALIGYLAARTEQLVLATGIANIYARDAITMRAIRETLGEMSHGPLPARPRRLARADRDRAAQARVRQAGPDDARLSRGDGRGDLRGPDAGRARADRARGAAPEDARALARRGARRASLLRAARAHRARAGDPRQGRLAVPRADGGARDRRHEGARDRAPEHADLPGPARTTRTTSSGSASTDADFENGGSDRLVDAIVAWGDEKAIARPHPGPPRRGRRPRLHPVVPERRRAAASTGACSRRSRLRDSRCDGDRATQVLGLGQRRRRPERGAVARNRADARGALRRRRRARARAAPRGHSTARAARLAAARRSRRSARPIRTRARRTPTASRIATSCAARAATSRRRPTSWPSRATKREVAALLDWCGERGVAAIPYGGGSSVVGGVEAQVGPGYAGAISIDLRRLARVLEIDRTSRAARIEAGIFGPALEDALRPNGLTLRHFPAVVRVLDARRLARHALGRALRHALHPHRRLRRVAARRDTIG